MMLAEFALALKSSLPVGSILSNPGGGTSKIIDHSQLFVTYRRGKSAVRVSYESLFKRPTQNSEDGEFLPPI